MKHGMLVYMKVLCMLQNNFKLPTTVSEIKLRGREMTTWVTDTFYKEIHNIICR
ncbi:rCG41027 [Rattus norvegicus]|uniref:RCG41027 n=1 Tax=Rattus norvegicus TaxID=10116 RepID=A6K2B5_RAT|nr:rCG41027 [Rattus norvegicus]